MKEFTIAVFGFRHSHSTAWADHRIATVTLSAKTWRDAFDKVQEMYPRASRFELL